MKNDVGWSYWNSIINIEDREWNWDSLFIVYEDGNIVQFDLEEDWWSLRWEVRGILKLRLRKKNILREDFLRSIVYRIVGIKVKINLELCFRYVLSLFYMYFKCILSLGASVRLT